jgi:E3 ubiquitin-protein ligase synoviolin
VEHVVDEFWYAVPETCLLFAAFREDLTPLFVVSLTTLFLIKAFHWLADVRIDFMERSPLITKKFHIRAVFLLIVLVSSDCFMMSRSIRGVMSTGPSVQMVYALEYAVLLLLALDVLGKYILHCIDRQSDNPWENKPIYKSYLEVVLGFFKVSAYFGFMLFMARVHIFPLYITRRLFVATKSFKKSIEDVIKSRRAIHNLNNLFPDVTPEQLEGRDNTCMVCREEMAQNCKMLPCGHIFHTACLRSWFQRQQVCPTCTASVLMTTRAQQVMMQQQNNRLRQQREQQQQQQQNEPQPGLCSDSWCVQCVDQILWNNIMLIVAHE